MHRRTGGVLCASAAAITCLVLAASAGASTSSFSGNVPNGGCDSARTITVNGPSRIDAQVSSSSASPTSVKAEIIRPDGTVAADGSYDTPGAGSYGIRVCEDYESMDPPTVQYTVQYATGPAGQPALPQSQGAVLGQTATISNSVHGLGAIRTHANLAWFRVSLDSSGLGIVKVYGPALRKPLLFTGAVVSFGTNVVRLTLPHMSLVLTDSRVTFRSLHFVANGKVVRGGFVIS